MTLRNLLVKLINCTDKFLDQEVRIRVMYRNENDSVVACKLIEIGKVSGMLGHGLTIDIDSKDIEHAKLIKE